MQNNETACNLINNITNETVPLVSTPRDELELINKTDKNTFAHNHLIHTSFIESDWQIIEDDVHKLLERYSKSVYGRMNSPSFNQRIISRTIENLLESDRSSKIKNKKNEKYNSQIDNKKISKKNCIAKCKKIDSHSGTDEIYLNYKHDSKTINFSKRINLDTYKPTIPDAKNLSFLEMVTNEILQSSSSKNSSVDAKVTKTSKTPTDTIKRKKIDVITPVVKNLVRNTNRTQILRENQILMKAFPSASKRPGSGKSKRPTPPDTPTRTKKPKPVQEFITFPLTENKKMDSQKSEASILKSSLQKSLENLQDCAILYDNTIKLKKKQPQFASTSCQASLICLSNRSESLLSSKESYKPKLRKTSSQNRKEKKKLTKLTNIESKKKIHPSQLIQVEQLDKKIPSPSISVTKIYQTPTQVELNSIKMNSSMPESMDSICVSKSNLIESESYIAATKLLHLNRSNRIFRSTFVGDNLPLVQLCDNESQTFGKCKIIVDDVENVPIDSMGDGTVSQKLIDLYNKMNNSIDSYSICLPLNDDENVNKTCVDPLFNETDMKELMNWEQKALESKHNNETLLQWCDKFLKNSRLDYTLSEDLLNCPLTDPFSYQNLLMSSGHESEIFKSVVSIPNQFAQKSSFISDPSTLTYTSGSISASSINLLKLNGINTDNYFTDRNSFSYRSNETLTPSDFIDAKSNTITPSLEMIHLDKNKILSNVKPFQDCFENL